MIQGQGEGLPEWWPSDKPWIIGDCLAKDSFSLKDIPDESVDLIPTDPPYNIGKDFENDNPPPDEYLKWCSEWIKECVRVLKVGGAFYLTLGWQCVAEIKQLFNKEPYMRLKNWIIWYRQDGWKGDNGFAQSHEHILYFIKDGVPPFNLIEFGKHVREKRLEKGYNTVDSLMGAMGLYTLVHRVSGKDGYFSGVGFVESGKKKPLLQEMIKLNELLDLDEKYHVDVKTVDKEYYNVFFNKVDVCDDVWLTPKSEHDRLGHPTQKPVSLFERIIKVSSNEGAVILDPFLGTGTMLRACRHTKRNGVGFEINPDFKPMIIQHSLQNIGPLEAYFATGSCVSMKKKKED